MSREAPRSFDNSAVTSFEQARLSFTKALLQQGHLYGVAQLPGERFVAAGTCVIREDGGSDWVDLYLPMLCAERRTSSPHTSGSSSRLRNQTPKHQRRRPQKCAARPARLMAHQGSNGFSKQVLAIPTSSGYTFGMKTAISLPDEVFEEAERLASRLKVSRSELYAKALQDFVRRHSPDAITDAYDQICSETEPGPEPFVQRAARKSLKRVAW